ncbi:hypothetical protein GCM10009555_104930 [Acrocarpospora macrocephala]|uniref:Uncharacterized protein n=1 Tax=Acrocarpospora macrocephala TaxID=150177 RepID=A0A5M3WTJ8_9ACTN|nr:hypothetical protein Amac_063440 [Acrocarpospora macrocephala]
MVSLFQRKSRNNPDGLTEPTRLPQRWVLIFTVAVAAGVAIGLSTANLATGVGVGTGIMALLHSVMD